MDRFWSKVDKRYWHQCWLWTGATTKSGYGKIGVGGKYGGWDYAHRVAYRLVYGELDPEAEVHHKCEVKGCVNPRHLIALTQTQHAQAHSRKRTRCRQGHPLNNVYIDARGSRHCRECMRQKHRRWYERHGQAYYGLKRKPVHKLAEARKMLQG